MADTVYLCCPLDRYLPGIGEIARQSIQATGLEASGAVRLTQYDNSCQLRIADICSQVIANPGPVVLVNPVQQAVVVTLRDRLAGHAVVLVCDVTCTDDLVAKLTEAQELHESGEPQIPRRRVVAFLLLRKLEREVMWAGKNKGYMWASDIPKGRGLNEKFSDDVPAVISLLLQDGLLIFKTSQGKRKYALNPERREEIYEILRERRFPQSSCTRIFERDERLESVRHLDCLSEYRERPRAQAT